jgi:hypothetical protein
MPRASQGTVDDVRNFWHADDHIDGTRIQLTTMLESILAAASLLVSLLGWLLGARAKSVNAPAVNDEESGATPEGETAVVMGAMIGSVLRSASVIVGDQVGAVLGASMSSREFDPVQVVHRRLAEAHAEINRQLRSARAHRIAAVLLVSAQFIVGGLLASSFVQQSLDKTVVGVPGVVVLTSSLIRQYYKPELEQEGSRARALRLRAVVREVEDAINLRTEGKLDTAAAQVLTKQIRVALAEVEAAEIQSSTQDHSVRKPKRKKASI